VALTVSAPIKIFALVGVLAALLLGGSMFVFGRPTEEPLAEPLALPTKQAGGLQVPAVGKKKAVSPVAKPKAKAAKPATPAKPKAVKPKPVPVIAKNGLPTVLMTALAASPVVIVALYDGDAKVDRLSLDEARAGAKLANAGFVALDVTRDHRAAEAMVVKLGVPLRAPSILIYTRPDALTLQLEGFRDRDTVAQAAQNALR